MKKTWQLQNLEGNGLQSINLAYAAKRKNTRMAYTWATLFPLGAHQFYLGNTKRAATYILLSILLVIFITTSTFVSAIIAFVEIILLTGDVLGMEDRVNRFNKDLKLTLSLQQQNPVPPDFKGRYSDEDATPTDHRGQKILSFAEQEALLKEMAQSRGKQTSGSGKLT